MEVVFVSFFPLQSTDEIFFLFGLFGVGFFHCCCYYCFGFFSRKPEKREGLRYILSENVLLW